jgi:hypothetical protein
MPAALWTRLRSLKPQAGTSATELSDDRRGAADVSPTTANASEEKAREDNAGQYELQRTSTDVEVEGRKSGSEGRDVNEKDATIVRSDGDVLDESEVEDESKHLHGTKLALLTFGLALATFVVALDNTIIATVRRR